MILLLSSGIKIISHSPPASPNALQLLADSEARAATTAHPGLEERSDNGSQIVQTVTQQSVMEQKAPVMEPTPKDDSVSAMETPVTVLEAEAKDSARVMVTPVTVTEAESVSATETLMIAVVEGEPMVTEATPVTVTEWKAESMSVTDTPVTVTVAEGKAESASATDTAVTPVTVMEAEAKSEGPELLQTDGPSNGIDPSQPLFLQPEPKPVMERITVEERHL